MVPLFRFGAKGSFSGGGFMFRRSIPAALFIDFDNVAPYGLANKIPNWTAWIEDGLFDDRGRRRRLLQKRVYWNSQYESHRDAFESNGYEAIMCPSRLRRGKSAADMIMALDAFEVASRDKFVNEFILLTTDSDFIPLFERLTGLSKSTVTLADPDQSFVFSTYSDHADIVIPTFRIREASDYRRQPHRFGNWRRGALMLASGSIAGARMDKLTDAVETPKRSGNLEAASQLVAALAEQNSGSDISKRTIARALEREFGSVQTNDWFGCGSYRSFIEKAATLRPDLSVRPAGGAGVSVRYKAARAAQSTA